MTYLLDANVFMSASRLHYGFDFCPAFWEWLVESNSAGLVFSIDKVQGEIQAGADELADWSDERGQEFFLRPDEEVLTTLTKVSAWCTRQQHDRMPPSIHFYSGGRLLSRGACAGARKCRCNAREAGEFAQEDKNTERFVSPWVSPA